MSVSRINAPHRAALANYDEVKKMSLEQLEFSIFACVYEEKIACAVLIPDYEKLFQLDAKMFRNKKLFEWAMDLVSSPNELQQCSSFEEILFSCVSSKAAQTVKNQVGEWMDNGKFIPAYFRIYCEELMERTEKRFKAPWI